MRHAGWLLLALPLAAHAVDAVTPAPTPAQELLLSARLWESQSRGDLAQVALEKYLRAVPDDPRAMLMLGEIEIRSARPQDAAKVLERLRAAHPQDPAVRSLEDAYRVGTRDRLKMATVVRLTQIGQDDEAVAQLRALFPSGAPGGELGVDYFRILASSDKTRLEAESGLRGLVRDNPGDPLFQLALANFLVAREATRPDGLRMLAALGARHDVDHTRVMDAWRDGAQRAVGEVRSARLVQQYLAAAPDDAETRKQVALAERAQAQARAQAADPIVQLTARGVDDLDHGRLDLAETELSQARARRPASGEIAGALGRLRLRQDRFEEARPLFEEAARNDKAHATRWRSLVAETDFQRTLRDADTALAAGQPDRAGGLAQAALKQRPHDADALALSADVARAQHDAGAE
ncbi:MAG TPA: tetratricopeptide repeat protein, partial [Nevskiaceae bacterium]|nr:tetratricopeptide repeat protein [Nevskiaceae bacterium]